MIFRPLIRRFSPWLTAYLLVVSVGLPLQRVYCMCMGEQWLSLTEIDHECSHDVKPQAEASHHKMACCVVSKGCEYAEGNHDCGDSETIVAQLDVDFTHELADWSLEGTTVMVLPSVPFWQQLQVVERAKIRPIRGPDPPPLPAGRAMLLAHQTFLI